MARLPNPENRLDCELGYFHKGEEVVVEVPPGSNSWERGYIEDIKFYPNMARAMVFLYDRYRHQEVWEFRMGTLTPRMRHSPLTDWYDVFQRNINAASSP